MKQFLFCVIGITLISCNDKATKDSSPATGKSVSGAAPFSTEGKTVMVYTTADSTNLRLTPTDTVQFTANGTAAGNTDLCFC